MDFFTIFLPRFFFSGNLEIPSWIVFFLGFFDILFEILLGIPPGFSQRLLSIFFFRDYSSILSWSAPGMPLGIPPGFFLRLLQRFIPGFPLKALPEFLHSFLLDFFLGFLSVFFLDTDVRDFCEDYSMRIEPRHSHHSLTE